MMVLGEFSDSSVNLQHLVPLSNDLYYWCLKEKNPVTV